MSDEHHGPEWSDVDRDADKATDYLDTLSALDTFQEYKRRSHHLLQIEEGSRIVDIGCGAGDDVIMLAEDVGQDGSVIGIDKSRSMIEEANARADDTPTASFRTDDVMDLSFNEGTVDGCRADRVFQHLEDPLAALREMFRVTRAGGRIVVSDADWGTYAITAPEIENEITEAVVDTKQTNAVSPTVGRRLYTMFRMAGLTDVTVDPINFLFTDFETMYEVTYIEDRLQKMVDEGMTSSDEAERWVDGLRQADQNNTLFGSVVGYTVAGTVTE
jgi:ubiquinone/menaquinone biosynthesis C-methylase UbiE